MPKSPYKLSLKPLPDTHDSRPRTGIHDVHNNEMHLGDRIVMLGMPGVVSVMYGAYGVTIDGDIDWCTLEREAERACGEKPVFLKNHANFISFYELIYNLNCEADYIDTMQLTGNE